MGEEYEMDSVSRRANRVDDEVKMADLSKSNSGPK